MDGARSERTLITDRVAQVLKRAVRVDAYRMLGRGVSGAATYRVTIDGTDAVLKLTSARSAPPVRERARREIAFYRELAASVPLRVPRVIGGQTDAAGCALLLAAYEPAPPPKLWRDEDYVTAAEDLARFHAVFWDQTGRLDAVPWLLRPRQWIAAAEIAQAHEAWRALWARPDVPSLLTPTREQWIHGLVDGLGALDALSASLPLTLCHGDCNPGNVLRDSDGDLVWADWQEVRLACGPADLSFLLQQASICGGTVPYTAALARYQEMLAGATGRDIPLTLLQRVVGATELRSRALHWPAYLAEAAPEAVVAMLRRIGELAAGLGITAPGSGSDEGLVGADAGGRWGQGHGRDVLE